MIWSRLRQCLLKNQCAPSAGNVHHYPVSKELVLHGSVKIHVFFRNPLSDPHSGVARRPATRTAKTDSADEFLRVTIYVNEFRDLRYIHRTLGCQREPIPTMRLNTSNVKKRSAVFLDRDGVLIRDSRDYIRGPNDVELIPGAPTAVVRLRRSGFPLIIVTNQAALAHGIIREPDLRAINRRMLALMRKCEPDADIDRIYFCPYHPDAKIRRYRKVTDMRKPGAGMLLQAAEELGLDLSGSFLIGDRQIDIEAAQRVGCQSVLVLTGIELPNIASWPGRLPDFVASDVRAAADWILERARK